MIKIEFTLEEVATFCNLLQVIRGFETPKFGRQAPDSKHPLYSPSQYTPEKTACVHLAKQVCKKHYGNLLNKDANPETGKVAYKLAPHEALAIYIFTISKPAFYFFNCQIESSNL